MIKIVQKSYEIFHKQTGVVFVSLLNPLGKIKRASKNLLKIFGYNFKELYDQSINILMPPAIGKHHDKILQFYISKGVEHPTEIKDMNKFLLGKRQNQCLVPLNAFFQLSLLGTDDFGLNVLFQVKSCNSEFIYFDKIQISSYRNNHSSQEQILVSFTNLDAEPPCVFNDNYQNPGSQNNGVMNQQQKDGNNSKMKNSVSKNAPTEEKNEQEIEEQNQKIFKSLGYCISNITPSAYVEIFLRCGIDFEKVRQMNFRKLIPLMYLDLEIGRQYKTVFILPKSEVLNKFYQVKSDAYVVKNKQIVSLFKLLDESSENDYDVFDFSFKILKQVAINAQEFFYLEICEYQKIEKAFDSFTLINEVKQIICNITKIKLPKSQKYQIYNKTKLKVSSMLEKIKEKNSKNATKLSDPYQTQFVQNNIILSDSVSSEDSDEEQYTINEGKKYSQDNEAEILQNLLGENIHTNDITEMSEMAEVPQLTQNMNSLSLSPIKLQNLIDKDSIEESKLDEIFELKLENQNQNLENIQNGKQSIFKQEMNMQIQKANNQAYSKLNNQNSLTNQNFENNLNQKYLKSFNKQLSFQKQAVKNHKQLIKRKSVQQKFFKSQPSNILSFASIMKEKSSELHHLNFTKNLSQTRNSQKLANLQQNNQQQNRNQSPRSEVPSESSQDKKLDDNEDDNDNSDDSDLKKDNKNLSKKKRQLFLNLDQSQDNLNISVDISEMLNDYVVSQINDKASASSFRNEFNALKRKIINYIFDLSKHALIYSILIFGIVSYLFFLTMTFVTYIIVNQSFTSQVDSIDQLSYSSLLVESHLYVAMIGQLMVNYNLELSSYSLNQTRIEQLQNIQYQNFQNYEATIVSIVQSDYQSSRIKDVFKNQTGYFYYNQDLLQQQMTTFLLYAMIDNIENFYYYFKINNIVQQINELDILSNIQQFYDQYNQVLNQSILNADDSVTYVQNLLKFGFILIETVSILSLLFVIPLYLAIQQQREIILKLFSNLTREKIENIILQIDQFLTFISQKQSNEKSSFYSTKNNYKSIEWKKRASSTTSNLKKCKTYLIVSGFVILLVVSVYPCVNFFYTNNFLSNYSKLIDEYVSLVRIKNLNLIKQTVLYSQIHQTIGTQQQIKDIIFNFEQTIAEETLKLQGLQQIKGDFDKSSGSQISQYENIFINPLSENICNLIDTNQLPIYSIDSNITQIEGCDQVWSGILQSGILVANIELFTQQDSIQKILVASNSNRALFIENFKKWESVDKTLNEFDKLLYWINAVYKTIQYQAQNENKSQFQLIKEVQLILLLIAIVLITIIYLVLWNIFIFTIYKEFIYTKQSLSLLHSSLIMENNYFLSFLKNQKLN